MTATRDPFNSATSGTITGDDYMDQTRDNTVALYDASHFPVTGVGGTVNAVTGTVSPDFGSRGLVSGMKFSIPWTGANTGAVTLALNGGSAIPVVDASGSALEADATASGLRSIVEFTGTHFQVLTELLAGAGALVTNYHFVFTSSGTWVKPAGLNPNASVLVKLWGGGGGGGEGLGGAGGGGGGYSEFEFRASDLPSSVAVTIGDGGSVENSGGNTTFGTLLTAYGGGASSRGDHGGGGGGSTEKGVTGGSGGFFGGGDGGADGGSGFDATGPWGGGGGGGGDGGRAEHGGGGGAGRNDTGGISLFAGNGGDGGNAGQAPGGGGGNDAAGARGEAIIMIR